MGALVGIVGVVDTVGTLWSQIDDLMTEVGNDLFDISFDGIAGMVGCDIEFFRHGSILSSLK
jgi:hypothetical protein